MGIINRFLLFVYAGVALLVALFVIAFATKTLPEHLLFNEIEFLLHQKATLTALGVVAFFSLYFLLYSFFVGEKKDNLQEDDHVVIKTKTGEVRVAKNAIESLTDREATSVSGVRESETKVNVSTTENGVKLSLKLTLVLLSGANVPKISDEVTNAVKSRIFDSLGIQDVPVDLSVRELNSAPAENQKRVH
jgi:uncharacterized alkaline shock family protein YloU